MQLVAPPDVASGFAHIDHHRILILPPTHRYDFALCNALAKFSPDSVSQAFTVIAERINRYHHRRPHSALGYKTPAEFTTKLAA
jgi:transposase InsO family protein